MFRRGNRHQFDLADPNRLDGGVSGKPWHRPADADPGHAVEDQLGDGAKRLDAQPQRYRREFIAKSGERID